jgi:hypothetical protein
MEDFNQYESADFYTSSVLLAMNCRLETINRQSGNFSYFVFNETPEKCQEIISAYWADELLINPKKLISAINELKTRLHQGI